jgi:dTDP-4-dehydrorhamnose 3,5-epimerase-like enzyme
MILEPEVYRDNRGFFLETYHIDKYRAAGLIEPLCRTIIRSRFMVFSAVFIFKLRAVRRN